MDRKEIIQRVWYAKANDQKLVTIPKNCKIEKGDYVIIRKVDIDGN